MSYLIMRRGPTPGEIYPMAGAEVRLGRGTKNDIIIDDNEVSREHLLFKQVGGGFELHDLTTTNGTFVNGQLVDDIWLLRSHCIIEVGDSITLEYRMGEIETDKDGDQNAANNLYYLVVSTEGQKDPVVYPLKGDIISVGRSTSNDIVIVEAELSRSHFQLTKNDNGFLIEDLGSTNGTSINGEPITEPHQVYPSDIITIGTSVQIHITNSPENYSTLLQTDLLGAPTKTATRRKRKTSEAEVAGVADMMKSPATVEVTPSAERKPLKNRVLVSYAREEWESVAALLVHNLNEAQIETWVDQALEPDSAEWLASTEQARLECWLMVVIVSPAAMESDLVMRNWRHFQNREKPIIMVVLHHVDRLPIGANKLARIQYNPAVPALAAQQLIAEIKRQRK